VWQSIYSSIVWQDNKISAKLFKFIYLVTVILSNFHSKCFKLFFKVCTCRKNRYAMISILLLWHISAAWLQWHDRSITIFNGINWKIKSLTSTVNKLNIVLRILCISKIMHLQSELGNSQQCNLEDCLTQWFPTFLGLRHHTQEKYSFRHQVANL